jgi:hypothetical protein
MRAWLKFVAIGIAVAFVFEVIASNVDPQNRTFQNPAWPILLVLWYGFLHTVNYKVFGGRRLWVVAVAWGVIGTLLEIVVFRRVNPIVDPIIYAIMFTAPHLITRGGRGSTARRA